jgi:hypothetical protein
MDDRKQTQKRVVEATEPRWFVCCVVCRTHAACASDGGCVLGFSEAQRALISTKLGEA